MFSVLIFLAAIVTANLSVAYFGPWATPINAFLLIGLNISLRDKLHEQWHGNLVGLKMFGLIMAGAVITYLLNRTAAQICIASVVAFTASLAADTIIYEIFYHRKRLTKMNLSNIGSSVVDSVLFPTLAFGVVMPLVILGQIAAKIGGGFLWSLILTRRPAPTAGTRSS